MNVGIYLRDLSKWREVKTLHNEKINWLVCGDYACPKKLPAIAEILKLRDGLFPENIRLHYISPKVNQKNIGEEASRVNLLLTENISVSINDWGLLYRIRQYIKPEQSLYIGRLLTKSVANWAWWPNYLAKENQESINYFTQSNFHHQPKLDLLKKWGVKGVEVNVEPLSENSYEKIKNQGLDLIGYVGNKVLAVARACPIARLNGVNVSQIDCQELCEKRFKVVPAEEERQKIYPQMELMGNVMYWQVNNQVVWDGYQSIIYYDQNLDNSK
jgi:hypothetical protein